MVLMRQGLLWLSERQGVFNFVRRNGLARKFASRFVAGETIEDGVVAAKELSRRGITVALGICIRLRMPSCMRAPPAAVKTM